MAVCYVTYSFVLILDLSQPTQQKDMQVLLVLLFTCHQQQQSQSHHHSGNDFHYFYSSDLLGIFNDA
jgi:hypothetical protein